MSYSVMPKYERHEDAETLEDLPLHGPHINDVPTQNVRYHVYSPRSSLSDGRQSWQNDEIHRFNLATLMDGYSVGNYTFGAPEDALPRHLKDGIPRHLGTMLLNIGDNDHPISPWLVGDNSESQGKATKTSPIGSDWKNDTAAAMDHSIIPSAQRTHQEPTIDGPECPSHSGESGREQISHDRNGEHDVKGSADTEGQEDTNLQLQASSVMVITDQNQVIKSLDQPVVKPNEVSTQRANPACTWILFCEIGSWVDASAKLADLHGGGTYSNYIPSGQSTNVDRYVGCTETSTRQRVGSGSGRANTAQRISESSEKTRTGKMKSGQNDGTKKPISNSSNHDEDDDQVNFKSNLKPISYEFACPFYKHDPQEFHSRFIDAHGYKFRTCATTKFPSISRLKVHKQPTTCPRCQEVFKEVAQLDSHLLRKERCPENPRNLSMILTPAVEEKLRRKTLNVDQVEKWREIYTMIFPGDFVQSSTHQDLIEVQSLAMRQDPSFNNFICREMPTMLELELDSTICQLELGITEDEKAFLRQFSAQILITCYTKLWASYQSQQNHQSGQPVGPNDKVGSHHIVLGMPTTPMDLSMTHDYVSEGERKYGTSGYFSAGCTYKTLVEPSPSIVGRSSLSGATCTSSMQIPFPVPSHPFGAVSPVTVMDGYTPEVLDATFWTMSATNLFGQPGVHARQAWTADSGYETFSSCSKVGCDDMTCEPCLKHMKSPDSGNFQLPNRTADPCLPVNNTATSIESLTYDQPLDNSDSWH